MNRWKMTIVPVGQFSTSRGLSFFALVQLVFSTTDNVLITHIFHI